MTQVPRLAAHDTGKSVAEPTQRDICDDTAVPFDLGIALSIYGKDPAGRLIALDGKVPGGNNSSPGIGTWPTEQ